jgi:hypothetical protein
MAKGIKTGGRNFEKGHKFAKGRPRLPDEVKEARKINAKLFHEVLSGYLNNTAKDVNAELKSKPTPNLERIILKILDMATKGNLNAANIILERMIGKVPDNLHMSGRVDSKVQVEFISAKKANKK